MHVPRYRSEVIGLAGALLLIAVCSTLARADGPVEFSAPVDITRGAVDGVSALDVQDLDGDGLMDLAVFEGGKHAGGRVTFAWFKAPSDISGDWVRLEFTRPSPFRPFIGAAKLGDVDGDGDYDLVVSMDNHSGATKSAYLYWLENPRPEHSATADWQVRTVASNLPVEHINDMALADMDRDGRLDVVIRSLTPNMLMIYFNDGDSQWSSRQIPTDTIAASGEGFAVGDIDRDGRIDVSINGYWLHAPEDARTQPFVRKTIDSNYAAINANTKEVIGDINNDGYPDVLIAPAEGFRNGGNHVLAWYEGVSNPTNVSSWTQHVLETNVNGIHTVILADLEGDDDLDIVTGVAWNSWGQTKAISVYFNNGEGVFGAKQTVIAGKGLYSGVARDVDGDGDIDIVGEDTYSSHSRPYLYEAISEACQDCDDPPSPKRPMPPVLIDTLD